jgi:hypothetical protein
VRGLLIKLTESEAALKKLDLDHLQGEQRAAAGTGAAYQVRWEQVASALSDLGVESLEAEALWGREAVEALQPLLKCAKDLQVDLSYYLMVQHERQSFDASFDR